MSDTVTVTLTEFLLARIAEDEDLAAGAGHEVDYRSMRFLPVPSCDADHIARHSPTRVLADCEAKRRIMDLAQHAHGVPAPGPGAQMALDVVLANLAAAYADHPDYREEWAL